GRPDVLPALAAGARLPGAGGVRAVLPGAVPDPAGHLVQDRRRRGEQLAVAGPEPGDVRRVGTDLRLHRRRRAAVRPVADQQRHRGHLHHPGPGGPGQPLRVRAGPAAVPRPAGRVLVRAGRAGRARGGAADPAVPGAEGADAVQLVPGDDPADRGRRRRHLHHAAVLPADPAVDGGGGPDRRRRGVPDVLERHPAAGPARAHHADDPELPGVLERVPDVPGGHLGPAVQHPDHRAGEVLQRPARVRDAVPGHAGGGAAVHDPGGDRVLHLPAALHRRPAVLGGQGL
ncbi:MAG: ABC transporter, permease protein 2 (cluster 1, maltose/g3p/polyamine/iron), partial [uncultured Corynebacteriales bacterium]